MKAPEILAALEAKIGISGKPCELLTEVSLILVQNGEGELRASELAETRSVLIRELIKSRQSLALKQGLAHILELCGTAESYICGSAYAFPSDSLAVQAAKKGRQNIGAILNAIRGLTFDEFEHFGAKLVHTFGAKSAEKTRQSGDQGIDFMGSVSLAELQGSPPNFFQLTADIKIDFIGQAKHYPTKSLDPSVVRELVGSLELARSRHFSNPAFKLIENVSLKSFNPVVAILITTGKISKGARAVADAAGIIVKSGDQIATYLAELGIGIDPQDEIFSDTNFRAWMEA